MLKLYQNYQVKISSQKEERKKGKKEGREGLQFIQLLT